MLLLFPSCIHILLLISFRRPNENCFFFFFYSFDSDDVSARSNLSPNNFGRPATGTAHTHPHHLKHLPLFLYFVGRNNASAASRLYMIPSLDAAASSHMHRVVQRCIRKPFSQSLKIPFVWNQTDSFFNSGQWTIAYVKGGVWGLYVRRWANHFRRLSCQDRPIHLRKTSTFTMFSRFPDNIIDSYACCIGGRRPALVVNGNCIELRVRWTKGNESRLECVGGRNRLNEIIAKTYG